jgi:Na+-driven multidrug efflux pump
MIALHIYIGRIEKLKEMWFWPNAECFKGIGDYISLGFFSMCTMWLEWCAFEFLTFMCGFLDTESIGAQAILFNFECLIYMPAIGFMSGAGAKVGNSIGENNVPLAKRYSKIT